MKRPTLWARMRAADAKRSRLRRAHPLHVGALVALVALIASAALLATGAADPRFVEIVGLVSVIAAGVVVVGLIAEGRS